MNAGEPLNEIEAEQMMKEADKDGDGTIDYEGMNVLSCSKLQAITIHSKKTFIWLKIYI